MKFKEIKIEHFLYLLAFLIALGFRFFQLGHLPLSDAEAKLALQALDIAQGQHPLLDPQPAYLLWTGGLFFIFSSSALLARFLPALAGSLLVLVPFLFRKQIGVKASVILSFIVALDPGLVALSRTADSRMFAFLFSTLTAGAYLARKPAWTGICLGLTLLAGPSLWEGLLGLVLAGAWLIIVNRQAALKVDGKTNSSSEKPESEIQDSWQWRKVLIWCVATLLAAGTLLVMVPTGLSAMAASFTSFLNGWSQPVTSSFLQIVISLLAYEILVLFWGIWGGIRGWTSQDQLDRFLSVWALIALVVVIIYPAGQVADLLWVIIPLLILSARQIDRMTEKFSAEYFPALGQLAIIFILLMFAFLNVTGLLRNADIGLNNSLRWVSIGGAFVLIFIISILVGWGWGLRIAGYGLLGGISTVLVLFTIMAGWNAAGLGRNPASELWRLSPYDQEEDLLIKTMGDVSEWNTGTRNEIEIAVQGVDSQALRWDLRNFTRVKYVDSLGVDANPALVITQDQVALGLSSQYTGEGFVWWQSPRWSLLTGIEWLRWALFRETPSDQIDLVLWVRSELFAGAKTGSGQ